MSEPFIGEIRIFAGNFAPRNWALCDGQLLPIAQNTALFSLLGTTFGGNGRTDFALPDLRGRVPMHPGNGPGLTSRRLGEEGGVREVQLTEAQMPSHEHALMASPNPGEAISPAGASVARSVGASLYQRGGAAPVALAPEALVEVGGGQPHSNLHPYLTMTFIIALAGLYPSRS